MRPGPDGPRVDGGLRAAAWVVVAARVRRCARIWSITEAWVMNAMIRMGPRHVGQASGSTSKICCRSAAHRRLASVGASRGAGTMAGGTAAAAVAAVPRMPRGRLAYQPSYRVVTCPTLHRHLSIGVAVRPPYSTRNPHEAFCVCTAPTRMFRCTDGRSARATESAHVRRVRRHPLVPLGDFQLLPASPEHQRRQLLGRLSLESARRDVGLWHWLCVVVQSHSAAIIGRRSLPCERLVLGDLDRPECGVLQ